MESIKIAQLAEVSAGFLGGLSYKNNVWHFVFENGMSVESYAGWILYEKNYGAKPLLGSRDVEQSSNPFVEVRGVLEDATCEVISFNSVSNATQLQFIKDEDHLSLELLTNSARATNWKISIGDHEESDIE